MDVNVKGVWLSLKHEIPAMLQKVRVNAVAPGAIETRMFHDFATTPEVRQMLESSHPIGRIGRAEEVASTVVWLCSDGASRSSPGRRSRSTAAATRPSSVADKE